MSKEMNQPYEEKLAELKKEMHVLNENSSSPNEKKEQQKELKTKLKLLTNAKERLENTVTKNNILSSISDVLKDTKFADNMNKQEYVLPLKNKKVLNMKTLEVNERTIEHKFNYECDVNYRELTADENSDIKKYFDDLFCGKENMTQVVLDILKSAMTGKTLRYIYFLTGEGRNGKSVLFNILKSIFKDGMDTISKDAVLLKKNSSNINTEIEKLDKCRIAFVSELKKEDVLNQTNIKAITGGDAIDLRALRETNRSIYPTANIFMLTNILPEFTVEQATQDRLIVIPFLARFDVNTTFEKEMIEKREQVFCYIMKHGKINENEFELTEEMKIAKNEYVEDNVKDYLNDFIENSYEKSDDKDAKVKRDEFISDYNIYCKKLGYRIDNTVLTPNKFTRQMKKRGFPHCQSGGTVFYLKLKPKIEDEVESEPETA